VAEDESEWSLRSTLIMFGGYRIKMNSTLLTDQLKTEGVVSDGAPLRVEDVKTHPPHRVPRERYILHSAGMVIKKLWSTLR